MLLLLFVLIPLYHINGALIAIIAGFIIANIIGIRYLLKCGMPSGFINFNFLKSTFIFGSKSQIGLILNRIDRRLDIFIINLFLNPTQVGYYAIAVAVAELPWHISNAIATVLFPEVSGMIEKDAYRFTSFICRNAIFVIFFFGILLFIVGGVLIKVIFGPEFTASIISFRILIIGAVIFSINKILCAGFSGTGRPEYGTYTAVFSAITTIILDLLFIPAMGIKGAAIASAIAYTISTATGIMLFRKMSNLPLGAFLLVTYDDIRKYPELIAKFIGRLKNV